jgi:20S proteasome subunit alpha 2
MGEESFSLTTFSKSGKLVQIEHALACVEGQGKPALGIKAKNGVVLATEKKVQNVLVDETTLRKIENVANNVGVVYAGMPSDYRVLLKKSRKAAQQYITKYREQNAITGDLVIPTAQVVREAANVMQEFTQQGGVRPFGVSLMICGCDDNGPHLYQVDPSGAYFGWKASAIGKDSTNRKSFLEKRFTEDILLEDAIATAILTLKENFEGGMTADNIEIGVIEECPDQPAKHRKFRVLSKEETQDYLSQVE